MAILSPIQKRSPQGRLLIAGMYALLVVGATLMVYPFLLMLSGSVKTSVDIRHFDIVPRYLHDDTALFRKFEEQRYGGQLDAFATATRYHDENGRALVSFEFLRAPPPSSDALLADWLDFIQTSRSWPAYFLQLGHNSGFKTVPELTLEYQRRLRQAFPHLSREDTSVVFLRESWTERSFQPIRGPFAGVYDEMRRELPSRYFYPTGVEGGFILSYLRPRYREDHGGVAALNHAWGTAFNSLYDVTLGRTAPEQPNQRQDWWNFVQHSLSARFVQLSPTLLPEFRRYARERYGDVAALNKAYTTTIRSWDDLVFPDATTAPVGAISDLESFLETRPSPDGVTLDGPEFRWPDFLRQRYSANLPALNAAHRSRYSGFDEVPMPVLEHDWHLMQEHKRAIRTEFVTRNYRIAWDYLMGHGRAFRNTLVFCVLNVLTALIINPLAAYALSRFQPRWGAGALLFLMATMAFPAEVTQIPAFLMLRELGLLNTFAALILPAAANGYLIFLLKGFFDSLPRELYEAAAIDGAGEMRIFLLLTVPLSTPVLAVVALGAFTAAYGAFMFALLVCQNERMWTLMVYIYQLQQWFDTPVVFAALVLAAIPTLVIFTFCQQIIMRGIVVPVEK